MIRILLSAAVVIVAFASLPPAAQAQNKYQRGTPIYRACMQDWAAVYLWGGGGLFGDVTPAGAIASATDYCTRARPK